MAGVIIDCNPCGQRYHIHGADPVSCPQCGSVNVTYPSFATEVRERERRELDFSVILDPDIDRAALDAYWRGVQATTDMETANYMARLAEDVRRKNRRTDRQMAVVLGPILAPMMVVAAVLAWHDAWAISAMFAILGVLIVTGSLALYKGWGRP